MENENIKEKDRVDEERASGVVRRRGRYEGVDTGNRGRISPYFSPVIDESDFFYRFRALCSG